jgi:plastocyanin
VNARLTALLVALAVIAAPVAIAAGSSGSGDPAPRLSRRLQIKAFEFGFTLSRPAVGRGRVTIEFNNTGEDKHNLRVKRVHSSARARGIPDVAAGTRFTRTFRLRPGVYRLYCSIRGHAKNGMRARLRVRR